MGDGECLKVCPKGVISKDNPFFIDRDLCTLCLTCVEVCPSAALRRVGQEPSVDEIVRDVVRYKPFFDTSGGGVTLSGGEPTLYMEFTSTLLRSFKDEGINTLLETNGWFDFKQFESMILPYVDMIYYDIKIIDPEEHKRWCGVGNKLILENFVRLHDMSLEDGLDITPRTPLIPGITDTDDKMQALAQFYRDHRVTRASLLENNPLWVDKLEKIGVQTSVSKTSPMRSFGDQETLARSKNIFEDRGIEIFKS